MQKWIEVDYHLCNPKGCDPTEGLCIASQICKYDILEQEEPYEVPMHFSREQCMGCGDCAKTCPLQALKLTGGV